MRLKSKFMQIGPMSQAKRMIKDNSENPEYRVVAAIRRLLTDRNAPQKNHSQTMLKISSISDLNDLRPPKY